jgi:hypothetical protein
MCLVLSSGLAYAQQEGQAKEAGTQPAHATRGSATTDAEKPLPGPRYLNLRYDEDFSYLASGAGSYQETLFDPIKHIDLGREWSLSLGGELRFRLEAETNKAFGANARTQDTFQLYRYLLHADVKYGDVFRAFVQGIGAFDEDRDLALRGIDENRWDLQQLFFDLKILGSGDSLTLRVGRQELQYGNQQFMSPLDWGNTRRRFDAVKLFAHGETWDVDLFYAKPVVVNRKERDRFNEEYDVYGVYVTYKRSASLNIDGFGFAQDRSADRVNQNGNRGDESRYTLGTRVWGKTSGFDYEGMVAGQWGRWAGDTICAWAWTLDGGYTFGDVALTPRLGVGFDFASGDGTSRDGRVETFDQLFPLGHAYLGYLDLVGRQNINDLRFHVSAWPVEKKVKAALGYHTFWLNEDRDALYNAGGGAGRRDPTGRSGKEVGQELDVTLLWKLSAQSSLLFGYSHFWADNFIARTGPSEDPDLFYFQYMFKF